MNCCVFAAHSHKKLFLLKHHIPAFQLINPVVRKNNKMGYFANQNSSKSGNLPNTILIKSCENTSKLCENTLLYNSDHHTVTRFALRGALRDLTFGSSAKGVCVVEPCIVIESYCCMTCH